MMEASCCHTIRDSIYNKAPFEYRTVKLLESVWERSFQVEDATKSCWLFLVTSEGAKGPEGLETVEGGKTCGQRKTRSTSISQAMEGFCILLREGGADNKRVLSREVA